MTFAFHLKITQRHHLQFTLSLFHSTAILYINQTSSPPSNLATKKKQMKTKKRHSSKNTAPIAASLTLLTILLFGLLMMITSSPATVEAASAKSCQADADCAHLVTHYFCSHQLCSCKLFYSVKEAAEKDGCTSIKCTKETDCTEGQDAGHKENVSPPPAFLNLHFLKNCHLHLPAGDVQRGQRPVRLHAQL